LRIADTRIVVTNLRDLCLVALGTVAHSGARQMVCDLTHLLYALIAFSAHLSDPFRRLITSCANCTLAGA